MRSEHHIDGTSGSVMFVENKKELLP